MIRAHLATYPLRSGILMQTVETILPQVDLLCICLNIYKTIPDELRDLDKVQAVIPEQDLMDAGKFLFSARPDDIVFTIDDDILYPPGYVAETLKLFGQFDPLKNVVSHFGNAWIMNKSKNAKSWKTYRFNRKVPQIFKADILGTGVACQIGSVMPSLEDIASAAGFVDYRHARLHTMAGRTLWVLPHEEGAIKSNLTDDLWASSLFETHNRARNPNMIVELRKLMGILTPHSGLKRERVEKARQESPQG